MEIGVLRGWRLISILVLLVLLLPGITEAINHRMVDDTEEIKLKAALQRLTEKYNVYFTYDKSLVQDIMVDYKEQGKNITEELQVLLEGTDLHFKIFEDQFVIIYKLDQTGIRSLKSMVEHFSEIIAEDESRETFRPVPKLGLRQAWSPGPRKLTGLTLNINGTVTDQQGTPLIGVNVQVKGTNKGTATDFDGKYSLEDVNENATLVFSYIGYQTVEVPVDGRGEVSVELVSDSELLDEVVVVGYGTQKKVNVIGSVSQISTEKIENRPVTQLSQAITGQMPGVTVIQRSGRPGNSGGEIRVRGVGSFGATPNALVLIDGIPGSLNELNPDNIQSISVLKDASSAAIYGARSANGVILVTTKDGTANKLTVGYNGYLGFNQATELPDFVDSWDFAEMYNIASGSNSYSAEDIGNYRSQTDPDNYPNTKFMEEIFSRKGVQTGHTLTINGGNKDNKYYLSGAYLNQNGIIEKNKYDRYNLRLNVENNFSKNLQLNTRLFGSFEERNEPQATANKGGNLQNQLIQNAIRYPATHLGQASNGDYGIGPESGGTPISWIDSKSYLINPRTKVGVNMKLDWNPINNLTFSAIGGYNFSLLEQRSYLASQRLNDEVYHAQSYLNQFSNKVIFRTMQFIGEYSKDFSRNQIDLLAGYSFENEITKNFNGYRQDFPSNDYTVIGMGGADNQQAGGFDAEWAIQSLFSRFKYNFDERYLFEATVRYDGSSRFPESKKYAIFPSMAVGWRLTEETFMSDISWLSGLKLKASWGILGNQNIGNYPYQAVLNSGRNYSFGGVINTGAAYSTYKDAGIQWESTETTDFGFESELLDGKIVFNTTYFHRSTEDILFQPSASVSSVLGVGISETNTGAAKNSGWEFELGHRNNINEFEYTLNANFSIINNEVITLGLGNVEQPNGFVGNGSSLFIGYPMQMYYGYISDGVFTNQSDIEDWPNQTRVTPNPQAGDIRYQDISGPDGVPDGQVDPTYDRTYLGSRIPKYTFGANLGFSFKNFDFSAFLQGTAGVKGRLTGYAGYAFFNLGNIQRWQMEGRFDPENPEQYPDYPRLEVITNSGTPNTALSDFWVINASYLRLKNIQLGYTLPRNAMQRIGGQNLRLYLSAENVLSFNNYRQGWDPEVNTGGAYYPILSTFTFGLNVKF
ncbi:SusC/RagA family TonB-linked outer membrane protein [Membranihabitans maritimus]|uniref:SusC/RagA family TonB-linked outer membrane protein n=1 Tax=Membranihabitans maritimus TaxID=2904244 RepID=UPI001F3BE0BD|nr:TonB-dependent receptor [Membranihabitans maritimus]